MRLRAIGLVLAVAATMPAAATAADGRWEYTLYDGAGSHPFIQALDTLGRTALCLDLDALEGDSNLGNLRLRPEPGGKITVHYRGTPMAFVDRKTRRVTSPRFDTSDAAPARARERAARPELLSRSLQVARDALTKSSRAEAARFKKRRRPTLPGP